MPKKKGGKKKRGGVQGGRGLPKNTSGFMKALAHDLGSVFLTAVQRLH